MEEGEVGVSDAELAGWEEELSVAQAECLLYCSLSTMLVGAERWVGGPGVTASPSELLQFLVIPF